MAETPPVVYLLYGEDEFSKAEFIQSLSAKMGDATMADLNTARLDGRTTSLADLENAVRVMPFLLARRIVILTTPDMLAKSDLQKKSFREVLDKIPETTALIIYINRPIVEKTRGGEPKFHWLAVWGGQAGDYTLIREYKLPAGADLVHWIQNKMKEAGGKISRKAAEELSRLVGSELWILNREIEKLLVYVNNSRPVEEDDVKLLTPDTASLPPFALVNALRDRDGKKALKTLHKELEQKEALLVFQSIVSQFRQLLLVREIYDEGGGEQDAARLLGIHPYVAKLTLEAVGQFNLPTLEAFYRLLLKVDTDIKTSQVDVESALDFLVVRWCT